MKPALNRSWGGVTPKYIDYDGEPVEFERPFTKTNWKSAAAREEWRALHKRMAQAKNEAEWRSVLDEDTDRKAAIIHVNHLNRERWLRRVGDYGLHYRDIRCTESYDGYSHKHYPTSNTNPNRVTYAVISTDEDVAEHFQKAELDYGPERLHQTVGEYLGFPQCCRDFFQDIWVDARQLDPMYETACNTPNAEAVDGDAENILLPDPNPGTNVLWRYFGLSYLTHIPCSFTCEGSIDVARNRYRIMCENGYEDAANALHHWLNEPHQWTGLHAICEVRNRYMMGCTHTTSYWTKKTITWRGEHEAGGAILYEDR